MYTLGTHHVHIASVAAPSRAPIRIAQKSAPLYIYHFRVDLNLSGNRTEQTLGKKTLEKRISVFPERFKSILKSTLSIYIHPQAPIGNSQKSVP
jgi:hypothetical protein